MTQNNWFRLHALMAEKFASKRLEDINDAKAIKEAIDELETATKIAANRLTQAAR